MIEAGFVATGGGTGAVLAGTFPLVGAPPVLDVAADEGRNDDPACDGVLTPDALEPDEADVMDDGFDPPDCAQEASVRKRARMKTGVRRISS
ncbi:MAG: hypothetical protein NVSMB57_10080 [Actinomycetota bacterium]